MPAPELPGGPGERLAFAMPDGDVLQARRDSARDAGADAPTLLLLHGLGGCETSHHMLDASRFFTTRGCAVVRVSLRGAGPSQATCRDWSHAGRFADLEALVPQLRTGDGGLVVVGFSLGGCLLLNYLARGRVDPRLRAAATVSTPLDLVTAADVLHRPRNRLYHHYLLRALKADYLNPYGRLSPTERRLLEQARTLYEVDDRVTAPRHGFGRADRYYAYASPLGLLPRIRVPTLLVHAGDDPFVPAAPYARVRAPAVTVAVAAGGGHLGFHDRHRHWHLRRLERFFGGFGPPSGAEPLPAAKAAC